MRRVWPRSPSGRSPARAGRRAGAGGCRLSVEGRRWVAPPVSRVGHELGRRHIGVADDPVCASRLQGLPTTRLSSQAPALHCRACGVMDVRPVARWATTSERTSDMADLRKCIGSTRFGIEPHEAPVTDFPVQPSQKDGLGRMCRPHWNQYTAGLPASARHGLPPRRPSTARWFQRRASWQGRRRPPSRSRTGRSLRDGARRKAEGDPIVEAVEATVAEDSIA